MIRFNFYEIEALKVGRFTNRINTSCILYRWNNTIIDTGPPNQWKKVQQFLKEKEIEKVLLTHHHEDHSGNACRIQSNFDSPIYAHNQAIGPLKQGFNLYIYQHIMWGKPLPLQAQSMPEILEIDSKTSLRPIHTPGHSEDMLCFLEKERGWLFTGDTYIASRPKYMRRDENPEELIHSIRLILELDFETIICSHRGIIKNGKDAFKRKLDFLVELREKVLELHHSGMKSRQITTKILGRETIMSYLSQNDFSKINFVDAIIQNASSIR